jgi:hypothetical protein
MQFPEQPVKTIAVKFTAFPHAFSGRLSPFLIYFYLKSVRTEVYNDSSWRIGLRQEDYFYI